MDAERGTVTSGGRGYYLMGPAVCLQQALIQLAMQVGILIFYVFFLSEKVRVKNWILNL